MENPCLSCGACCAHFRVSFYWGEADPEQGGSVPVDLTEDVDSFKRCMKGTNQKYSYCIALQGEVGQRVFCSIYDKRSTTCREFGIEWERGVLHFNPDDLEQCMKARAAWGLAPISLEPTRPNAPTPPLSDDFAA